MMQSTPVEIVSDELVLGPVTVKFSADAADPRDGFASAAAGSGPVSSAAGFGLSRHGASRVAGSWRSHAADLPARGNVAVVQCFRTCCSAGRRRQGVRGQRLAVDRAPHW
jgi:hypothetical protein